MEFEHRFDKVYEIMKRRGITDEELKTVARIFLHAFVFHEMGIEQVMRCIRNAKR